MAIQNENLNKRVKQIKRRKIYSIHEMLDIILNGNEHDNPNAAKCQILHNAFITLISIVIGVNIAAVVVSAVVLDSFFVVDSYLTSLLEISSTITFIVFSIEFILRFIASDATYKNDKRHVAKLKYLFSFMGFLDILSILPFITPLSHIIRDSDFSPEDIHLYIVFLVALILKMIRYFKTFRFIIGVFQSIGKELLFGLLIAAIVVLISGTTMFYIEREAQPEAFKSIADGFWWSILTYTTVGYGNIIPITPFGKILAGFIAMIGVVTIALPSGIISSAFIKGMPNSDTDKGDKNKISSNIIVAKSIPIYRYCPYCGKNASFDIQKPFCQSCGIKVYNTEKHP